MCTDNNSSADPHTHSGTVAFSIPEMTPPPATPVHRGPLLDEAALVG